MLFWSGNESENSFLILSFTKNYDFFFEKMAKKTPTFLVKKFCDNLTKIALS